ncbi:urate hydroxylase PuuD [Amphritea pacifica]|uniref:Urate hydroxylase PuuD n=1 Tax=Amphritea pacifica TaxID=2811233 RepID=A0ABS2W7U9_9GAMM|nr:urate hydroxylase PuuD [Amphritea pacifica]MBN0987783.1 urate hydroxylase PuuD [Amphritea pacifica]
MDPHITEWLNLAVRWVHMITGIAWIGASFYFVWLENHLDRSNPREGLSGDLWAIHGGGIYHLEKYKLAPPKMPEQLHWFKWEAYATFLSGFTLLAVVYYLNAQLYLVAPGSDLSSAAAIGISVGSLVAGWFIYTTLCDSPLGKKPALLGLVLFVLLVAAAWGFTHVFSGRAAFIHIGAMIGTIMVGNVFFIIMPAQSDLVGAINAGREPDPALPAKGLLRSRHNNYFTLPVLFIMISNHFPSTYSFEYNWAILAGLAILSVLVRHYFNTRHESQKFVWTLPAAALGMIALAFVTAPKTAATSTTQVSFTQVKQIIDERCSVCHSTTPTFAGFTAAPLGVIMDNPQQIQMLAPRIQAQAITTQAMPLGNITQMTQQERDLLGTWIAQGALTK